MILPGTCKGSVLALEPLDITQAWACSSKMVK